MALKAIKSRLLAVGASTAIAATGAFVGLHEGEVRRVYSDIGGVSTYCFGGTTRIDKQEYSAEDCAEQLLRDTELAYRHVQREVQREMPWSVHAAMTSATYNAGVGAFSRSPMLPLLREGRWEAACAALVAPYTTSKGVARGWRATVGLRPVRGLENRRAAEYALCVEDLRDG